MGSKRGLSVIIATLLLVTLTLVLVGIIWGVVDTLVKGKIKESEACSLIFGKMSINSEYTCYKSPNLQFSISRGDIEVDKLIVAVSGKTNSTSVDLSETANVKLTPYGIGANAIEGTKIPEKNAGKTYLLKVYDEIGIPESLKIAPVINGVQCDIIDSLNEIDEC